MTYSAPEIVRSLVDEFGWEATVDALIEEVKWAPGEDLKALEELLDVVMADLTAGFEREQLTLQ